MTAQPPDGTAADPGQTPVVGSEPQGDAAPVVQAQQDAGAFSFDRVSEITPEMIESVQDPLARAALEAVRDIHGDYTRKTQTLSEQRRELESNASLQGWVKDLATALESDPEQATAMLKSALTQLDGGQQQQGPPASTGDAIQTPVGSFTQAQLTEMWENADPTVQLLAHSVRQQQQVIDEMRQSHAATTDTLVSREIATNLAKLHEKYGDFDEDPVLAEAQGMKNPDLDKAYRIVHFDTALQRGETSAVERMRQKREAAPPAAGGAGGTPQRKKAATAAEAIALSIQGQ